MVTGTLLLCSVCALSGCTLGPQRLHSDFVKYNTATRNAFADQLLLNLVRTRYGEAQDYLVVEGISTQYLLEHDASVSGTLIESANKSLGLGTSTTYNERPTVTYSPTQRCATFNTQLRRPFSLEMLHYLLDDGYPRNVVLNLMIREINNLKNAETICGPNLAQMNSFEDYQQVVYTLSLMFDQGQLELHYADEWEDRSPPIKFNKVLADELVTAREAGYEFRSGEDAEHVILQEKVSNLKLRVHPQAVNTMAMHDLTQQLRVLQGNSTYDVELASEGQFDRLTEYNNEILISTRSFSGLMKYLAPAVRVPQEHCECGLVDHPGCSEGIVPFVVHVSKHCPKNVLAAAPYRGYWYYIDAEDQHSRTIFRLLNELALVQLSCENITESGPVLTLPLGG